MFQEQQECASSTTHTHSKHGSCTEELNTVDSIKYEADILEEGSFSEKTTTVAGASNVKSGLFSKLM